MHRQESDFHISNYPGIQIVHIRIHRDPPVSTCSNLDTKGQKTATAVPAQFELAFSKHRIIRTHLEKRRAQRWTKNIKFYFDPSIHWNLPLISVNNILQLHWFQMKMLHCTLLHLESIWKSFIWSICEFECILRGTFTLRNSPFPPGLCTVVFAQENGRTFSPKTTPPLNL